VIRYHIRGKKNVMFLEGHVRRRSPELRIVREDILGAGTTWGRGIPAVIRSEKRTVLCFGDHSGMGICLNLHGQLLRKRDGGESECTASVQLISVRVAIVEMTVALKNRQNRSSGSFMFMLPHLCSGLSAIPKTIKGRKVRRI